jgi:hypothetical protein
LSLLWPIWYENIRHVFKPIIFHKTNNKDDNNFKIMWNSQGNKARMLSPNDVYPSTFGFAICSSYPYFYWISYLKKLKCIKDILWSGKSDHWKSKTWKHWKSKAKEYGKNGCM